MTVDNVVYLSNYVRSEPKQNVVQELLDSVVADYSSAMCNLGINTEDPTIAFDIATIRYLLHGMAHRSQGELHPSQTILNTLRNNMLGF